MNTPAFMGQPDASPNPDRLVARLQRLIEEANIGPVVPTAEELDRLQKAGQVQVGTLMGTKDKDLMTLQDSQRLQLAADGNIDRLLARLQRLVQEERGSFNNFRLLCAEVQRMVLVR